MSGEYLPMKRPEMPASANLNKKNALGTMHDFGLQDEKLISWTDFHKSLNNQIYRYAGGGKINRRNYPAKEIAFLNKFVDHVLSMVRSETIPVFSKAGFQILKGREEDVLRFRDRRDVLYFKASDILNMMAADTGCNTFTNITQKEHGYIMRMAVLAVKRCADNSEAFYNGRIHLMQGVEASDKPEFKPRKYPGAVPLGRYTI